MCSQYLYVHGHSVHLMLHNEHTKYMSTYDYTTDSESVSLYNGRLILFPLKKLCESILMCTCYGLRILLSNATLTGQRLLTATSKLLTDFIKFLRRYKDINYS